MDFHRLPSSPDDPRYKRRLRAINSLLSSRKERLIEEGMMVDRDTAVDDFWWFNLRFTPFSTWRIDEAGHPMFGRLWIEHGFLHWLCRHYQAALVDPPDGWVWIKTHRKSIKTTILLNAILWCLARDRSDTCGLWTHKVDEIGSGMGRGLLAQLQTDVLRDHFEQYRVLEEGTKQGFTVTRPAGPRDQSLAVLSIATSTVSLHPRRFFLDDVESDATRDNPSMIAKVAANIAKLALMQHPGSTFLVANTPWDKTGPLLTRESDNTFARIVEQTATSGGRVIENGQVVASGFTPEGSPNLHTMAFFEKVRRDTKNDSLYYPQMEFKFHRSATNVLNWASVPKYREQPKELAKRYPFVNIIVDGAGGKKGSDATVIRVLTWTANDAWANLDLIRERCGLVAAMQILLGRDPTDPSSEWVRDMYCPGGVGLVEKWMRVDPELTLWFDDAANQGWSDTFMNQVRQRRVTFCGGKKLPRVFKIPQEHFARGTSKEVIIRRLEVPYQQGLVSYPEGGFVHAGGVRGSHMGMNGAPDPRDTMKQFQEDEFDRLQVSGLPHHDDMLNTEAVCCMEKAVQRMRRPAKKADAVEHGGLVYPKPSISNPWGVPGGGDVRPADPMGGRSWVSI